MIATGSRPARAFTLVETAVSLAVVGLVVVSSLEVAGRAAAAQGLAARRAQAWLLAEALLGEAREKAYADPEGPALFGPEPGETPDDRATFDDADDYHGYGDGPVLDAAGATVAGLEGWSRRVSVAWVQPAALNSISPVDAGAKRVRVEVSFNGALVLRAYALVTDRP